MKPVLRPAPSKPFTKVVIAKGYGFHTPQDGSVCKIRVISDDLNIITDLDESKDKEVIVGDVDEPIERIIEDCIRTMKEEEVCCLKFVHPCAMSDCVIPDVRDLKSPEDQSGAAIETSGADVNQESVEVGSEIVTDQQTETKLEDVQTDPEAKPEDDQQTNKSGDDQQGDVKPEDTPKEEAVPPIAAEIQFQLLSYTREPEIWEMSVTEKWRRACYHKQRGLELYSRGAYQYAFRRFGLTLKYVISLEHDIPAGQEDGMDIKGLKLSCYLNVAACQMRHHNYESVVNNSSKALVLQPNNAKALYRRGAALLQLQEYERAREDLTMAQSLEPKNQAVAKQLQLLKCQVQKLNQYYASAMKKLFT
ncbi:hypothetical protein JTE90_004882 [Oedothorax gibbosus]|uniref:Uncharacterized protein n=1 Tax=Oedothorax gibbosus TaxID=931172 RepID=A0AAV6UTS8_9ARAC|nr:hypothetical protein JTE90_004882 [Oedothorax gibbosus]